MVEMFKDMMGGIENRLVDINRGKSVLKVIVQYVMFQTVCVSKTVTLKGKI
jgi:hypothetical protein